MASRDSSEARRRRLPLRTDKPVRLRGTSLKEVGNKSSSQSRDFERDSPEDSSSPTSDSPPSYSSPYESMAGEQRMVIAIDYGTTFTGVAYGFTSIDPNKPLDIRIVKDWGASGTHDKIPSVISYSETTTAGEEQWGLDLSPNALAMVNTKLELDVQDRKLGELELILHLLDGVNDLNFDDTIKKRGFPEYTEKAPEDVACDYLTKVFQCVEPKIDAFGQKIKSELVVDIVITVPVKWSYRAKNSTLRAIRKAGFNGQSFPGLRDVIMTTEPEAAALYTARYLQEQEGANFLKKNEVFLLCDAGGGTVDVVTYQVKQLEPNLQLQGLTYPTGDKYGAIHIDQEFKKWLQWLLPRHYRSLDSRNANQKISAHATESGPMRTLMKTFDTLKKRFEKDTDDMILELPHPLNTLTIEGIVSEGMLTITNDQMKAFFDPCVDGVIELIKGQILQIERKNKRVKTIFLVGGFGESPYLQQEVEFSMRLRGIKLKRPDTSWTAVVRGGCMYGIERDDHQTLSIMKTCPRYYGVMLHAGFSGAHHTRKERYDDPTTGREMANGQLTWLVAKGDLLLSTEPKESQREFGFNFREHDDKKISLPVYEYSEDDVPVYYHTAQEELVEVARLQCDFSKIDLAEFDRYENPTTGRPYYTAMCICKAILSEKEVRFEILWNGVRMCSEAVKDGKRITSGASGNLRPR